MPSKGSTVEGLSAGGKISLRFLLLGLLVVLLPPVAIAQAPTEEQVTFFEAKIRPLFEERCSVCHGDKLQMASLRLTTAEGFFKGADSGPIVVKGQPESSRLIQVVNYEDKIKMPPTGKLAQDEIEALKQWVRMGAPWPNVEADASLTLREGEKLLRPTPIGGDHWAFRPIRDYQPPRVKNVNWVETPIDNFILAKFHEKGLEPPPPADKLTLLRRAKFDLHGLPPTMEEIKEFLGDDQPGAFARLVDRLLASPRYGETWGRHWLDVARYADSTGVDEDRAYVHAWRYRDYVINAFNQDLPYDQFVREQIAGDLLSVEGGSAVNERGIVATGFLALGPKPLAQQDKVKMVYDVVDEQIDTTSKAFMGLTISCARCHNHKFDPISTKDYYSLASIFASTRSFEDAESQVSKSYIEPLVPKDVFDRYRDHQNRVKAKGNEIKEVINAERDRRAAALRLHLANYMVAAWQYENRPNWMADLTVEEFARQQKLEPDVLDRLIQYLRPDQGNPHLKAWYQAVREIEKTRSAMRDSVEQDVAKGIPAVPPVLFEVARNYQSEIEKIASGWERTLAQWKQEVERATKAGPKPPEEPRFDKAGNRFYADLFFDDAVFGFPEKDEEILFLESSRARLAVLRNELETLKKESPEPPLACAVAEGGVVEQAVFVRGNHQNPGEKVPKQFPEVLAGDSQSPITQRSGRKELAAWLTRDDHPLTSRVAVNRIWQWHFGEGLVRTPDNFGTVGEKPTHPELLDYLAKQFIRSGWSIKSMHRLIMLSSTYQMSSRTSGKAWAADPSNRLWSRFNRRRLTVEEMRDGLLAASGSLDSAMGGPISGLAASEEYSENKSRIDPDSSYRRTVYLPLNRNKLPTLLSLFDFVDSTTSTGKRSQTNVAPQGLYILNSQFMDKQADALANHLLLDGNDTDADRVKRAYLILLTREPTPEEVEQALTYVQELSR